MSKLASRWLVLAGVSFCSACSSLSGSIERSAIDYNVTVENMVNEVTLLNVVRAMKGLPRHYTALSQIQGDLTVQVGGEFAAAVPEGVRTVNNLDLANGAQVPREVRTRSEGNFAPKFTGSVSSNPNFTVAVLATQDFYRGLLRPLDASTISLYLSQGWSDELVAHLFFEGVDFEFNDGTVLRLTNDPKAPDWRNVVDGLSLRSIPSTRAPTEVARFDELTPDHLAKLKGAGFTAVPLCANGGGKLSQCEGTGMAWRPTEFSVRLGPDGSSSGIEIRGLLTSVPGTLPASASSPGSCYLAAINDKLRSGVELSDGPPPPPSSDSQPPSVSGRQVLLFDWPGKTRSQQVRESLVSSTDCVVSPGTLLEVSSATIATRSTDGVIYYIGEYLNAIAGSGSSGNELTLNGSDLFKITKLDDGREARRARAAAVLAADIQGETWVIPRGEHRSMQVIGLIDQLVNLNKKAKDLPTPTFIQVQ